MKKPISGVAAKSIFIVQTDIVQTGIAQICAVWTFLSKAVIAKTLATKAMNRLFRVLLLIFVYACTLACASNSKIGAGGDGDEVSESPVFEDKYESLNRKIFAFNDTLDGWILKPVAKGYRFVTPAPVKTGVRNFFSNLGEVGNILNDMLQWKWKQATNDSGRLLLNSTVGVLGFFDVAAKTGLEKNDGEDFGQTLAAWGFAQGPYLVLPLLGPSSLRDVPALPVDWATNPVAYVNPDRDRYALAVINLVQIRESLLDAEELASGDRYTFFRDAWLQRREYLINDGQVEDKFGDEYDDEFE